MTSVYCFGRFEVRPHQRLLVVDGAEAKLGARAFDVLLALIERGNRLVSKDELLDAVWHGLVVEENNLVVQIGTLRKLLGAHVIATIPGRGYRFTASPDPQSPHASTPVAGPPKVLAPLFGREDELVTLPALARAHRVVTVIGAGGIGKTHLVRHLLQQRSLDEEVRFVDLSGLQAGDAAQVPRTVAAALGVQLGPGDPARGIADALAEREMLLALDNAEHLVDAVAHLAEILVQTSPGLRIIVTSQIPLGIAPERVFRLAGLALPDGPVNVVSATGYSAIAFFVDRAQAADRHFTLTDDNVDLVVEICRQLDGLPLAMELAAARLQSVGLRGLSVALEHRFRLLTGGRRLAPARQQTLEAALDWSHELLDTREQAVFRRLGVFVGSFALSTAQRVAADEQLDEWAVVDALTVLVDRSLVVTTEHDPPRYRLLDSPRAYALARLHGVDEDQTVARRHALAMRDRFWQADQDWQSGRLGVDAFRADIQPDLADGRVALTWAVRHESEVAVALAPCLDWAMVNEPPGTVRRALWETTAPLVADTMPVELRARWWMGWSSWTTQFGGIALRDKQRRAIDEVRRLGDRRALVWMLRGRLWTLAISEGGGPEAIEESDRCIHEIRAMEEPSWPPVLRYMRMRGESEYSRISGDQPESIRWLRRAGALAQDACDSRARHSAMVALVDAELSMQRYDDATRDAGELVEALCSTPFESTLTYGRHNLALAHIWRRDFAAARMVVTHSWPLSARFDILGLLANNLALLAAFEGRLVDAARLAGYANHQNELRGQDRQSNESRAVREAERLAVAALGVEEFIRLKAEGRTLTKAELRQLAI